MFCFLVFLFVGSVHFYWGSAKNFKFCAALPRVEMLVYPLFACALRLSICALWFLEAPGRPLGPCLPWSATWTFTWMPRPFSGVGISESVVLVPVAWTC